MDVHIKNDIKILDDENEILSVITEVKELADAGQIKKQHACIYWHEH
jgi:hypothetical protein